jgi:hypothetical protein
LQFNDTKQQWALSDLKLLAEVKNEGNPCSSLAFPWFVCGPARLSTWIADESFVLKGTERIPSPTGDLIRVHFFYDKSRRNSKYTPGDYDVPNLVQSGHIDLDPAHSYRVMAHSFRIKAGTIEYTEVGTMEYDLGTDIPILKTSTVESVDVPREKLGPVSTREVHTYKIEYNVPVSAEECRLAHFGLPEPAGVTWPSPRRWYLWFIGIGAGCLAVAVYFWRRAQRRVLKPTPD